VREPAPASIIVRVMLKFKDFTAVKVLIVAFGNMIHEVSPGGKAAGT
jgi:hypothetical protein